MSFINFLKFLRFFKTISYGTSLVIFNPHANLVEILMKINPMPDFYDITEIEVVGIIKKVSIVYKRVEEVLKIICFLFELRFLSLK